MKFPTGNANKATMLGRRISRTSAASTDSVPPATTATSTRRTVGGDLTSIAASDSTANGGRAAPRNRNGAKFNVGASRTRRITAPALTTRTNASIINHGAGSRNRLEGVPARDLVICEMAMTPPIRKPAVKAPANGAKISTSKLLASTATRPAIPRPVIT